MPLIQSIRKYTCIGLDWKYHYLSSIERGCYTCQFVLRKQENSRSRRSAILNLVIAFPQATDYMMQWWDVWLQFGQILFWVWTGGSDLYISLLPAFSVCVCYSFVCIMLASAILYILEFWPNMSVSVLLPTLLDACFMITSIASHYIAACLTFSV